MRHDEPCGYCGSSQDPNDICESCWDAMNAHRNTTHTAACHEYWERGLECRCIPQGVADAIRSGAHPEDVM